MPDSHWLSRLPPLGKVALWLAFTLATTVLLQAAAYAIRLQPALFSDAGKHLLLPIALIALAAMAIIERRPASNYGLAFPMVWHKEITFGLSAGLGVGTAYYTCAWLAGAMVVPWISTWRDALDPIWIVPVTLIIAFAHQLILSGYFLSVFQERYGTLVAIVATALVFPLLLRTGKPADFFQLGNWREEVGLFLTQVLLATIRVGRGNILLSGGLLAGFLISIRVVEQTHLLDFVKESPLMPWIIYRGDPRRSPAFWAMISLGIAIASVFASRRRMDESVSTAIPASLKRVYPLAMPMCLATLHVQFRVLANAGWRVGPEYLVRLAGMLVLSSINELLCLPERLLAPFLARRPIPPPIFVLGVHRSGTTHLHNLLALDPNLIAPRNHHVLNPMGALLCGWPISALLGAFIPWQRPMDAMQFHLFSANEEEFAIACESSLSPYWGWALPQQGREYDRFLLSAGFTEKERRRWQRVNLAFLRKLTFWSGKRPVLKNPCNTGRLEMLLELAPEARIVHIHRHPHDTYRSNMHFFREGHVLFQLQDPPANGSYADRFLENYAAMERAFLEQSRSMPFDRIIEVGFEDLEKDALGTIRRIYERLKLPFLPEFEQRLAGYLATVANYQKNKFRALPEEQRAVVDSEMGEFMRRWGYASGSAGRPLT